MRVAVILFTVLCLCGAVLAVDLKNEDSRTYEIKIHDGPSVTNSSISGNTLRTSICSDCKVEVVGIGTVEASGDQVVIIRDGNLIVED